MAAALAHDIGHPPFGHTGEEALQRVLVCDRHREPDEWTDFAYRDRNTLPNKTQEPACEDCILIDGFEGNAQSFRILSRLAGKEIHESQADDPRVGLNLTREVLAASLKYPWLKGGNDNRKPKKWGAYDSDVEALEWVIGDELPPTRTLEAQAMDAADDIAYAIHDLEDFYQEGITPLESIRLGTPAFEQVLAYAVSTDDTLQPLDDEYKAFKLEQRSSSPSQIRPEDYAKRLVPERYPLLEAFNAHLTRFPEINYTDNLSGREKFGRIRSKLVQTFINDLAVEGGDLVFRHKHTELFIEFIKKLTWYYVIDQPNFRFTRRGQEKVIISCFNELFAWAVEAWLVKNTEIRNRVAAFEFRTEPVEKLPPLLNDYIEAGRRPAGRYFPREVVARAVVDFICTLTDEQLYVYSARISGARDVASPFTFRS